MDEILIEKVRQYELLYNPSSHEYRNQRMRQEAWEEIGRELKITADKAKQSWDKLRRCFSNARNRRLSTKSGQATKNIPVWKFGLQMSFLLPYLEGRRTCNNLVPDIENNAGVQECQVNVKTEVLDADDRGEIPVESDENTSYEDMEGDNNMGILDNVKMQKQCSKTTNAAAEMVHIMQENENLRKRKYANQEEEKKTEARKSLSLENMDDIELFFLSMAKMTKKLPKHEQTSVKLAVSNAVLQAEQRSFERQLYSPQTSVPTPLSSAQSSSSMQLVCSPELFRTPE